jgi:hypothetical protein
MSNPSKTADSYWQMAQAAFACAQCAFMREDMARHHQAAELFRKNIHKWKQAKAREKQTP